jgi:nucleotidyltransferase/DNA polymerase involved in DNA repair
LIDDQEKKAVIIQLNAAAEQTGVRSGMTPSQGLARCLQLIVKVRARAQEHLLQGILLRFAGTLAPYVEETGPGISTIQFTDAKNLGTKVMRVIEQLADFEIIAQAGIAPTPDASFLAAHLAKPILQIENASEFLAALPIETLAID